MIVGLDIGGNNLKLVPYREGEGFGEKICRPTGRGQPREILERAVRMIKETAAGEKLEAVTIGICGLIDHEKGKVVVSGALPRLRDFPLTERIREELGVPAFLFNDGLLATYGEWQLGAGKDKKDMLFLALGKGVTGGAVCGGCLLEGHTGNFGGFGHISVDPDGPLCMCGNRGCLCILGSSSGLAHHFRDLTHEDKSPEEVSSLAVQGDQRAIRALHMTCRSLGLGIGAVINAMDPELVVIGGGLSTLGETLLEPLRREIMACVFPEIVARLTLVQGALGIYAGAMGGVLLARNKGLI